VNPGGVTRVIAGVDPFTLRTASNKPNPRFAITRHGESKPGGNPRLCLVLACGPSVPNDIGVALINADIWNQATPIILFDLVILIPPPGVGAGESGTRAGFDVLIQPEALVGIELACLEMIRRTSLTARNDFGVNGVVATRVRILYPWSQSTVLEATVGERVAV
jgi:hypothetical protein